MQIFILDEDPYISASYLCDKHIVCMPKEAAQMLSTSVLHYGGNSPYKKVSANHPCTLWAKQTSSNWLWLKTYGIAMAKEYTNRYHKEHKCQAIMEDLICNVPEGPLTPFAQVMPGIYKRPKAVDAYRALYLGEKARFAKWKHSLQPEWFRDLTAVSVQYTLFL